jgi:hypothetical protein
MELALAGLSIILVVIATMYAMENLTKKSKHSH